MNTAIFNGRYFHQIQRRIEGRSNIQDGALCDFFTKRPTLDVAANPRSASEIGDSYGYSCGGELYLYM